MRNDKSKDEEPRSRSLICNWLLTNPEEIKQAFNAHHCAKGQLGTLDFIEKILFNTLEREAKEILEKASYSTDLDDLRWEDDIEDHVIMAAKNVLFSINNLRPLFRDNGCQLCKQTVNDNEDIVFLRRFFQDDNNIVQEVIIETALLVSAAITMGINPIKLFWTVHDTMPDHNILEGQRERLEKERGKMTKKAQEKRKVWLDSAKKIQIRHESWSIKSIASQVCKDRGLSDKSCQSVYKFLLDCRKKGIL